MRFVKEYCNYLRAQIKANVNGYSKSEIENAKEEKVLQHDNNFTIY